MIDTHCYVFRRRITVNCYFKFKVMRNNIKQSLPINSRVPMPQKPSHYRTDENVNIANYYLESVDLFTIHDCT